MFDNLKAFIRQGKHAGDSHRKKNYGADSNIVTGTGLMKLRENSQDFGRLKSDTFSNSNGEESSLTSATTAEIPESSTKEYSDLTMQNDKDPNAHYEAASHIVKQENHEREKKPDYENLENYEIIDRMGDGAFSVVYKARHLVTNLFVAIKVLRKYQMDSVQRQSVLKEVTIMRQLKHPNIVRFIEFIDSNDYYYIVQELATGGEIFSAIVNYTYFSEDLSRHVIVQVAKAIKYLHDEVGIVHRDIKPENLLYIPIEFRPSSNPGAKLRKSDDPVTKQDEGVFVPGVGGGGIGVVKLADFGLSKQVWEHNTKTPCGTVGYTAPEIVRDERYSKKVDMWAMGCVLYTLLCGFPPFYDERIETLTKKVARGEFTFLSPWWDEISDSAKLCVSRLLAVNPQKRYSIDEFLNDPWVLEASKGETNNIPIKQGAKRSYEQHPLAQFGSKYQNNNKGDLYSPAVVAFRDAFDISTAVNRMEEEAALASKGYANDIGELLEEEEEETEEAVDAEGHILGHVERTPRYSSKHHKKASLGNDGFDLKLNSSSILERRRNKATMSIKA